MCPRLNPHLVNIKHYISISFNYLCDHAILKHCFLIHGNKHHVKGLGTRCPKHHVKGLGTRCPKHHVKGLGTLCRTQSFNMMLRTTSTQSFNMMLRTKST
jgi:hypothetical protein